MTGAWQRPAPESFNPRHHVDIGDPLPYMQRLTWDGIAMHAGDLPGYPASGGCIRLPYEFSRKIYSIMGNGSTVVITRKRSTPSRSGRPANTSGNVVSTMRSQLILPNEFQKKVSKLLAPGTILVATSERSNASTRSSTGFDIIGTEQKR